MRHSIEGTFLLIPLALLFLPACQKQRSAAALPNPDQTRIAAAKNYFEQTTQASRPKAVTGNPRLDAGKSPAWESAYCLQLSRGPVVVVPVYYQKDLVVTSNFNPRVPLPLNQLTRLVIYPDSSGYHMQLVTSFPDTTIIAPNSGKFSGIAFVETWQGTPINSYKLTKNKVLRRQPYVEAQTSRSLSTDGSKTPAAYVTICYEIDGYNYAPSDPDDGESWSEPAGCEYDYIPDLGAGSGLSGADYGSVSGGGGTSSTVTKPTFTIPTPDNIIANITDYLKCFSNYGGSDHTYQVTICVSQPAPGTRDAWAPTTGGPSGSTAVDNPVNAGHTFLVLSEIFSDHSVVRNVGFYPQTLVYPGSPSAQGQLNNDANHTYNISLTVTVDNGQFFNILNYIDQGNNLGFMYNLSTNNCTSFDLHALEAGSITLPATVGSWTGGGYGYDPGDLGEDIRSMQLSSNMTRNTVSNVHPNMGTCD